MQQSEGGRTARSYSEALAPLAASRAPVPGGASNQGFRRSKLALPTPLERGDSGEASRSQAWDQRSNAMAIAQYTEGLCPAEDVLRLTTSLLTVGGDFARSMALFRAVKEAGIPPNVITYSAMISACEAAGRADEALALLDAFKAMGGDDPVMRPNVVTYSAAISACEKAGWADEALALLGELKELARHDPALRPNVVTYSAAISACEKAGRVDEALALLDELRAMGEDDPALRPNVITYSAAISACMGAAQAGLARGLVAQAIQDGIVLAEAGYDAQANTLDFHANRVFREPAPSSRPGGVPAPVARALLSYHGNRGNLNGGTQYIVGQHGGDAIKMAVLEALNRVRPRAYVVSPTNAGMLVATAPNPQAPWFAEDSPPPSPGRSSFPIPDGLADRLRAMWPQAGTSEAQAAEPSDAMSVDDAGDTSSDDGEDCAILIQSDPGARTAQLNALKERVHAATSAKDVLELVNAADTLRAETAKRYPVASDEQLKAAFLPGGDNIDSTFQVLRDMMLDCDDAALAWQAAADHYWSACGAALTLGLPGDFVTPLDTAEAECEAQAARLEITQGLLEGIWHFKGWRQAFDDGHPNALKSVLEPLRRALALCNAEALAELPLRDVPIQAEFNDQLNIIHGDAEQISLAGGMVLPLALLNRMLPEEQAVRRAMSATLSAEIVETIALLRPALRGEMPKRVAPEPMSIDEPRASEPAASVALAELLAHVTPSIESAKRLAALSQAHQAGTSSEEDHIIAFGLRHEAVTAFGRAVQTFEAAAAAGWPSQALSAPQVQALHAEVRRGREAAVGNLQAAAGQAFAAMWGEVRGSLGQVRDARNIAELMERMNVPADLRARVAGRCQRLRNWAGKSTVLQRASDIDAARMVSPFAALQAFLDVAGEPLSQPDQLLPAAAALLQMATAAKEAGAGTVPPLKPALREFSTFCADLRMQLVRTAHNIERKQTVSLCNGAFEDIRPVVIRVEQMLQRLVDPKSIGVSREASAGAAATQPDTAPTEAEDQARIETAEAAAQRLELAREGLLRLPPDAPAELMRWQANLELMMRGAALVARQHVQLIRFHERAGQALGEANPAQRAKLLRGIAEGVRAAGAKVGEVLADSLTLMETPGSASANLEIAGHSAAVGNCERLAESMRFCIDALARLADGAQNMRQRVRSPARDADAFERETETIMAVHHDEVVDQIYEARERIADQIEAAFAAAKTPEAGEREVDFVDGLVESLTWCVALEADIRQREWTRATLHAAVAQIADTSRNVPLETSDLLSRIEASVKESNDRLKAYEVNTGNQAHRDALRRGNVILSLEIRSARTRLIERLTQQNAALEAQKSTQAERAAANAAEASQAQPAKAKGKGKKKSKAK
ncbi:hypothetical protein MAFF211271_33260 (plasmid) [Ralstonia syzygii subsp. indonesiensis]|nr:hypothetical protein MAFF211271_33260 [Ralstonia pseudosolanacearum]